MRKILFSLAACIIVSLATHAQSGTTKIEIGPELSIPVGNAKDVLKMGFGGSAKALFGICNAGQISLTSGYITFKGKDLYSGEKASLSVIPLMAGYRQNFSGFYVEPQAGAGLILIKDENGDESEKSSSTRFTWAIGAGYIISNVDVGVHYQRSEANGGNLSYVGIKIAYNIPL